MPSEASAIDPTTACASMTRSAGNGDVHIERGAAEARGALGIVARGTRDRLPSRLPPCKCSSFMRSSNLVKISVKDLKAKRASAALARVLPVAKRGPGRPRKTPLPEAALAAPKRGPGRPRKHPLSVGAPLVKRGPGRPRKAPKPISAPKRGRPRKAASGLSALEKNLAEIIVAIGLPRVEALIGELKKALG